MKNGDRITGINAAGVLQRGVVRPQHSVSITRSFVWLDEERELTFTELRDEGVTWIRGWHEDASTEAQALLAAWKLRPPRAMDLRVAEDMFLKQEISYDAWIANLERWDAEQLPDSQP
ncbi:MAG: hypothetical protein A2Y38_23535 [Spirochaetes bacterium GWB1_59_5]|nr:MAG: hypothetical protein A2Y38_23535 [Spirochaetes bacterium GWB1_59_5]